MKAAVFHQHGPLENLRIEDYPKPQAQAGECLLRVKAVSLNGFDPMVLRGIPGLKIPLPMIPGADIAAEIVGLGSGVDATRWRPGDRVAVAPNHGKGMMGETLRGGLCEYIAVDQQRLLAIPDGVSDRQAACLPTAYGAAIRMLYDRGRVAAGETVLILGASGGVGTCCVQLAKLAGCEVIACTSSAEKAARLKTPGGRSRYRHLGGRLRRLGGRTLRQAAHPRRQRRRRRLRQLHRGRHLGAVFSHGKTRRANSHLRRHRRLRPENRPALYLVF